MRAWRFRFSAFGLLLVSVFTLGPLTKGVEWIANSLGARPAPLPASIEGQFVRKGQYWEIPAPRGFPQPRLWGSWAGPGRTGTLRVGPISADSDFNLFITGYPHAAGIALEVINERTGEKLPIHSPDPDGRWVPAKVPLPDHWRSDPVSLLARDDGEGENEWIGVSEPYRWFLETRFSAQLCVALLVAGFFLPPLAVCCRIGSAIGAEGAWRLLAGIGLLLLTSYVLFWITYANPAAGTCASAFAVTGSMYWLARRISAARSIWHAIRADLFVVAVIAFLTLAIAHIHQHNSDFLTLAQNRFQPSLPIDNALPLEVASRWIKGDHTVDLGSGWLVGDRPPLQAAIIAWVLPFADAVGVDRGDTAGIVGLFLQLLWVPVALQFFRETAVSASRSLIACLSLSLAGFFLLNSFYSWPKLLAGSLVVCAFILVCSPGLRNARWAVLLGALLVALGYLAHGGVAFSLLAALPWIFWRIMKGQGRVWAQAFLLVIVVVSPWWTFQKVISPPGDRLLKWHLAGAEKPDQRPFTEILIEAYTSRSLNDHWGHKLVSLRDQLGRNWSSFLPWESGQIKLRRSMEFFYLGNTLGLWLFALVPAIALAAGRGRDTACVSTHLLAWAGCTIPLWCVLMYQGGQAIVHQGSYAVPLTLFFVSARLAFNSTPLLGLFALAGSVSWFVGTWMAPPAFPEGPDNALAWLGVATGAWVAATLGFAIRKAPPELVSSPRTRVP
ncbi:MAG: hypothetical protein SFV32_08975 [Opitutaceae bacterium]|nr:hypothetical protein [Opitutaceae bacterium]